MPTIRLNEDNLTDVVVIANTPTFLFERFRRDSSVQALSEALTAPELACSVSELGANPNQSFMDKVCAYAYMVALSFKPPLEQRNALAQYPLPPLLWVRELAILAEASAPSITQQKYFVKPRPTRLSAPVDLSSTSRKTVAYISYKPTVQHNNNFVSSNSLKVVQLD